jgi:hypothetical protein
MGSNILRSAAKAVGHVINAIPGGQYIGDALAVATGNPELIPLITGASETAKTGSLRAGLLSGAGSYVGGQLGGALGSNLGTVGQAFGDTASNALSDTAGDNLGSFLGDSAGNAGGTTFGNAVGSDLGSTAGNAISTLSNVGLGSTLGGFEGSQIGGALGAPAKAGGSIGASAFVPSQAAAQSLPTDLSQFANLDPNQQESNIATKGVYGGGLGPDEQSYFNNLVNRQLTNSNNTTNPISNLSPIENSYLQQLGLGGYGNSNDLLQAMSKWTPQ